MRRILTLIVVLLLVGVGWYVHERPRDYGASRFYADQTYHFETLRVLNDTSVVGGDPNEVLQTIANVKAADAGAPSLWQAAFFDWLAAKFQPAQMTPMAQQPAKT
jgi:hypothetical protein